MLRRRILWPTLSACLLIPWVSASGQFAELRPGARIRFRAPGEVAGRVTGTVLSHGADSLVVASPNLPPISVRMAQLSALEISHGKSHGRGALKGLAWAVPIGLGLGLLPIDDDPCSNTSPSCHPPSRGVIVGTMVLGSAIWGVGIGAIVGSEQWDSMTLPAKVGLVPPTFRHGPGLGATIAFGGPPR